MSNLCIKIWTFNLSRNCFVSVFNSHLAIITPFKETSTTNLLWFFNISREANQQFRCTPLLWLCAIKYQKSTTSISFGLTVALLNETFEVNCWQKLNERISVLRNKKYKLNPNMILSNGITLRCSQPWLVGVLGGPVVPAHQPRQIIDGNQTQRPTVSTSWNRGFAVRPQSKRATGVLCVEKASFVWKRRPLCGKLHC